MSIVDLAAYRDRRRDEPPAPDKCRNGVILLHGDDVPDILVDTLTRVISQVLRESTTDFMVSRADADCFDYFDEECS